MRSEKSGPLWLHSGYTFHRGTMGVEEVVEAVADAGWGCAALTDLNGIYGAVWFDQFARAAGLRPIIGAEVDDPGGERVVLLVKDLGGYARLCRIVSARHLDQDFSLRSAVETGREDLVVLTDRESLAEHLSRIGGIDLYLIAPPSRLHRAVRFASAHGIKPVAANAVYYRCREDRELHRVLRAIGERRALSRVGDADMAPDPAWLPTPDELRRWYEPYPETLRNLEEVVEKCTLEAPPWGEPVMFDFRCVDGGDSFELLCRKVRAGAARRYGTITPEVRARVRRELRLIRDKGFASYFLIIEDIVRRFPITCGRGSAAAGVVSYCLFITHVDPVRHNLLFERFLSEGRKDPPDIDVDFPWDERDGVLDYVFDKYGPDRTAMVANHLTFQSRSAIRDVARLWGIPEPEISRVTKRMRGFLRLLDDVEHMRSEPLFRGVHFDPPWDNIIGTALRLEGVPRGLSVHCGGVVIADDIKGRVPLQTAPKGVNIVQWEKDQAEGAGLVKLDLLGNRSLAVIRDAIDGLADGDGNPLDYASLDPLDDPETQRIISRGETMGVFYIESPATRQLQVKTGVGDFEHVVIHSSIIRPAAHRFINEYVKRLGGEKWTPVHPKLDEILAETYGIMVYQEDVMKVAAGIAGFTFDEASELRKVLGNKHREKKLRHFRERFAAGAMANGLDAEQVASIWDMMLSFAGYSFCKPHSASYALVSFKSAWLRTHHPARFMAAVISNGGGYYSARAYISEARRMGIEVLPPDINSSDVHYTAEGDRAMRVGLTQIKGLENAVMEKVVEERSRRGSFADLADFLHRVDPDPEQARALVKAGCFDSIEGRDRRAASLWVVNAWEKSASRGQMGLFKPWIKAPSTVRPLSEDLLLKHEIESFGFPLSTHPLRLCRDGFGNIDVTPACELGGRVGRWTTVAGLYVTGKHVRTSKGDLMEFVSFEDETAIYETVFFPDAYRRYCHLLGRSSAFLIGGPVVDDNGAVSLHVESLRRLR